MTVTFWLNGYHINLTEADIDGWSEITLEVDDTTSGKKKLIGWEEIKEFLDSKFT